MAIKNNHKELNSNTENCDANDQSQDSNSIKKRCAMEKDKKFSNKRDILPFDLAVKDAMRRTG